MRRRIQLVGVLAATLGIGLFGVPLAAAVVLLLPGRGDDPVAAESTLVPALRLPGRGDDARGG
jgi:hypothetical protein